MFNERYNSEFEGREDVLIALVAIIVPIVSLSSMLGI